MATQGPWTAFYKAKLKTLNGTVNLSSDTVHIVLCTSSQALTAAFTGTSGNAQYSDLTAELATANGYTNGGQALTSVTLTLTSATVTYNSANASWTLTGSITFKYAVIVDWTTSNKDLLFYCDMDTGGGSVSPAALPMQIQMNGIETWT
jgi:hypothetical protein